MYMKMHIKVRRGPITVRSNRKKKKRPDSKIASFFFATMSKHDFLIKSKKNCELRNSGFCANYDGTVLKVCMDVSEIQSTAFPLMKTERSST